MLITDFIKFISVEFGRIVFLSVNLYNPLDLHWRDCYNFSYMKFLSLKCQNLSILCGWTLIILLKTTILEIGQV